MMVIVRGIRITILLTIKTIPNLLDRTTADLDPVLHYRWSMYFDGHCCGIPRDHLTRDCIQSLELEVNLPPIYLPTTTSEWVNG